MRIALILTQLEAGGAQRVAIDVAAGLRARGHQVETWFLYEKSAAYTDAIGTHVLHRERPRGVRGGLSVIVRLWKALRRFQPDATISFTHYANVLGSAAALLSGVPKRIASQQNPTWSYPRLVRWADRILGAVGLYTSNVLVSRAVEDSVRRYPAPYRRRTCVVLNGTALRRSSISREDSRRRFGFDAGAFVVLAVGRLHEQKNHALLVRAVARVPGIILAIAGDGALRDEIDALARQVGVEDRLRMLGSVPSAQMPDLLRAADVFAMPSRYEGLSLALVEALSAGVPVVSSDIPPQQEVLVDESGKPFAVLLDCDDVEGWADALRRLAESHQLRRELSQAAADRGRRFGIDATVQGYEEAAR